MQHACHAHCSSLLRAVPSSKSALRRRASMGHRAYKTSCCGWEGGCLGTAHTDEWCGGRASPGHGTKRMASPSSHTHTGAYPPAPPLLAPSPAPASGAHLRGPHVGVGAGGVQVKQLLAVHEQRADHGLLSECRGGGGSEGGQ